MMTEQTSIEIVRLYALRWGISTPEPFRIEAERKWFRLISHKLQYESEHWEGVAYVERGATEPFRFDFRPNQHGLLMPPLWAAHPTYSAVTIGWRMGVGEDYWFAWWDWYSTLSDVQRDEYRRVFPVPTDDRNWNLWFCNADEYDDGDDSMPVQ